MWLVGMMGSGKTTAGRIAAQNLDVAFHDTDDVIVERMGCSIAQFGATGGKQPSGRSKRLPLQASQTEPV